MNKLNFEISINQNIKNVWYEFLSPYSYPNWVSDFNPGAHFEGSWELGTEIKFLDDKGDGIAAMVEKNIKFQEIKINCIYNIHDYMKVVQPKEEFVNMSETYLFEMIDDKNCKVKIISEVEEDFVNFFNSTYPKALEKLKQMSEIKFLTIDILINSSLSQVWKNWNDPDAIAKWYFSSVKKECSILNSNLEEGGEFSYTMCTDDQDSSYDLQGIFLEIEKMKFVKYMLLEGRIVDLKFEEIGGSVKLTESFQIEPDISEELQIQKYANILENFKKFCEID